MEVVDAYEKKGDCCTQRVKLEKIDDYGSVG